MLQTSENQLYHGKHLICQTSKKSKKAANIRKAAFPWQTFDVSNIRKTKKCCKPAKTSFTRANIRYVKHLKNQKVLQTSENQLYHGEHPICQISEKPKSAANIRKAVLPWRTSDLPNIRKTKKCCKHPKSSFSRANIRYVRHPKNQKVLHTCENQLYQGNTSDISNIRKNKKCCKHPKSSFSRANIRCVKHPKKQKVVQTCENQLYQGKHPICQTSKKPKSAAIIRKPALPWQTSDMSNIRKTKKCCKHPKTSFTMANIRYAKYPKNQKVLQTSEKQFYHGEHPICQISEKLKSAANIRKAAFPGQTSDMSDIRKTKKCCIHAKTSFTRANIRYVKHSKTSAANIRKAALPGQTSDMSNIQKLVLQTSEKQLCQGKHPICQTSEKPKSAANIRKAVLLWRTSDLPNIRKTKKCCNYPKTSFTMANIRYVKHPKNQKVLQTSEKQLYHGEHPICQISEKPKSAANIRKAVLPWRTSDMPNIRKIKKCCKHPKSSFSRANIRYVRHSKTSAANIRKAALPGQTSDMSNIRKIKKSCKHPKSSFSMANIRCVKHPKNQKVLQTSEKQFYHGEHPICQISEKLKSAAIIRKPALPWQTSDMSNI